MNFGCHEIQLYIPRQAGLSPVGAEGRCAPKKMAKNEIPPQVFPASPLYHIQVYMAPKSSPGIHFL